jgi:LysR family transcriptional regulator, flagellar master operon regulator
MNIHLLKTFLAVASLKHFGKAADRVCLTQSAVSARIKLLEETLGSILFERKRNHIELTAAGRRLALSAEQIIKQWEQTKNEINLVSEDKQQLLRIGTVFDLWSVLFHPWIIQCREQHPELLFQIQAATGPLLNEAVISESLDAAFVFDPPYNNAILAEEVDTLELVLVSSQPVDLKNVQSIPYSYVDWGISFSDLHQQYLGEILSPTLSFNFSAMAIDHLLQTGGMCYLARPQITELLEQRKIHIVDSAPVFQRQIYFIYRKAHQLEELLRTITPKVKEGKIPDIDQYL